MQRRILTIKQVAEKAGVDRSTVSRALNPKRRELVSPAVVRKVEAAARALGYRPNPLAASLRTRRSGAIGVLLPDITNPVFPPIIQGVEASLRVSGCVALIAGVEGDAEDQARVLDQLIARRVDGLIIATAARDEALVARCVAARVPFVLVNRSAEKVGLPTVVNDDRASMRLAVQHLASLGHRRIGHVAGPEGLSTGHTRRLGFLEAMREIGLRPDLVTESAAYAREAGRRGCQQLLDRAPDCTAIVAANDLLALGCYDAVRGSGRQCPRDVSIVGHNDMPLMDLVSPPLTTVRIQHREMGVQAARLLIEHIESSDRPGVTVMLEPTLVVRASTAAPRARGRSAPHA